MTDASFMDRINIAAQELLGMDGAMGEGDTTENRFFDFIERTGIERDEFLGAFMAIIAQLAMARPEIMRLPPTTILATIITGFALGYEIAEQDHFAKQMNNGS